MNPIHHGCARQAPSVGSIESAGTPSRKRENVLDALSFVQNDPVELGFGVQ